jgi:multidrug resistance efflux pump
MKPNNNFIKPSLMLGCLLLLVGCTGLASQSTPTPGIENNDGVGPVVSATGIVVPAQWSTLSMKTSGVVREVPVDEDQVVEAGQVLVRLEGEQSLQAAIATAKLELFNAQQALDTLYKDPEVRVAEARQAVIDSQKAAKDAKQYLLNIKTPAPKPDIDQARANMLLAKHKLDLAQEDFDQVRNKNETSLVYATRLSKLAEAQKKYDAAQRLLNNLSGVSSQADIDKADARLALAQANLESNQRRYEDLQKGPDPDEVKIAQERLANAQVQLAAAEAALVNLELLAPFSGTVSELNVRRNEWLNPGQPVLILADLANLQVETTDLNEIDVARIQVGDQTNITFDALPDVLVTGLVTRVAPKSSQGSGVNYKVIITLDEVPENLRWGMTAFVDIPVSQ